MRHEERHEVSEERTKDHNGARSFEERVFARFDRLDASMQDFDARLQKLEAKQFDTKPIWERALAEIAGTRQEMRERFDTVDRKFDLLIKDVFQLRTDQSRADARLEKLESRG